MNDCQGLTPADRSPAYGSEADPTDPPIWHDFRAHRSVELDGGFVPTQNRPIQATIVVRSAVFD